MYPEEDHLVLAVGTIWFATEETVHEALRMKADAEAALAAWRQLHATSLDAFAGLLRDEDDRGAGLGAAD
jgi:hypothetical protein